MVCAVPAAVLASFAVVCAAVAGGAVDPGDDPGVGHRLPPDRDHLPLRVLQLGRRVLRGALEGGGIR